MNTEGRYKCGCKVDLDGNVEPCEEAKRIFEEGNDKDLDHHYNGQLFIER